MKAPRKVTAFTAYVAARNFAQAAKMTLSSQLYPGRETAIALSLYLLTGFAIELYLKSFLLHKGWSQQQVSQAKIRHDLDLLHAAATENGMEAIDPVLRDLITAMAPVHRFYAARYFATDDEFPKLDWQLTAYVMLALDDYIEKTLDVAEYKRQRGLT